MSISAKNKWANVFTILVVFFTAFQGVIPTMPISNATALTIISAVTMFMVTGLTTWKQFLSNEIDNAAMKPTLVLALVATFGALNDMFTIVDIGAVASQWLRFVITLITMFLNVVSKMLYPTNNTNSTI